MMATDLQPDILIDADTAFEPPYRILIHNDNETPFDFVIAVLQSVFKLGREIAEHITLSAHVTGVALVAVRPRRQAERLVKKAHLAARLEGFPLTFSLEPEDDHRPVP